MLLTRVTQLPQGIKQTEDIADIFIVCCVFKTSGRESDLPLLSSVGSGLTVRLGTDLSFAVLAVTMYYVLWDC